MQAKHVSWVLRVIYYKLPKNLTVWEQWDKVKDVNLLKQAEKKGICMYSNREEMVKI